MTHTPDKGATKVASEFGSLQKDGTCVVGLFEIDLHHGNRYSIHVNSCNIGCNSGDSQGAFCNYLRVVEKASNKLARLAKSRRWRQRVQPQEFRSLFY